MVFLPLIILRVPQKKKSSSLEDLQSESLEKVGLFVLRISMIKVFKRSITIMIMRSHSVELYNILFKKGVFKIILISCLLKC